MVTKKQKTWLGGMMVLLALFIISPVPDFTDIVGFSIFSTVTGHDINTGNFSVYFLQYTIFTFLAGIFILIFGMNLLGKDLKWLKKRLDIGKYKIAIGIGVAVVGLIAYMDIQGLIIFTELGRDYTSGDFPHSVWLAHRNSAYILMGIIAFCYYAFGNRDKSETLAVFLTPFILFWTGLADVLYFVFQGIAIPQTLPWLNNHIIIGNLAGFLNSSVTNSILLLSVMIGFVAVFMTTKILKERF